MKTTIVHKTLAATAATSVLLLTAACGGDDEPAADETTSAPTSVPTADDSASASAGSDATGAFKAGEYDAEGGYTSPSGPQTVEVEMTIDAAGTIQAVEVDPQAEGGNSEMFQKKFAGGISDAVVGKKIDQLKVKKVAGSSLTSGGFNDAVAKIMAEAKA